MAGEINYRVKEWHPPPRPDWVHKLNQEGSCLDIKSVVPLDESSLLAHARANTGLADFGSDDWHEPFRIFIESLEQESQLTLTGRILTRSDLLQYLEARLRIEDTYKRHPEIEEQELASPMMIVGSGRSGTSAMQNLLSYDPDNGTPRHWEALFPCPPPEQSTYHTDPRVALADRRMRLWNRVTPEMESIHEWGGDMPTELIQLEALSFQAGGWLVFCGFTPSYDVYLSKRSAVPGLRYAKRALKLLQWKNPRKRWLLKSPDSMRYLQAVFEVFPDMRLIWMHRDPLKTVSSMVSLVGTILWVRSDRKLDERAIAQLTNPAGMAGLFDMVIDQIERGQVPKSQLHSIQYLDFIEDPMRTVRTLYREMGIELTAAASEAMRRYLREHPRESRPAHLYSTGNPSMQSEERRLFARYQEYFHTKNEL